MGNVLADLHVSIWNIGMGSTVMKRNKTKGEAPVGEEMRIHTGFIIATNSLYSEVVEKLGSLLKEKRDHEVVAIGEFIHSFACGNFKVE